MAEVATEYTSVYPSPPPKISFEDSESIEIGSFTPAAQFHLDLKSVPLLLASAEKDPEVLRNCEALWIESPDKSDLVGEWQLEKGDLFARKCEALARVLDITATHGRLQRFDWTWESSSVMDYGQPEIPARVWRSLAANAPSLKSLNVTPTMEESGDCYEDSWNALPSSKYSSLHHLTLVLERAHEWDGSKLHRMLKRLKELRSLYLFAPMCCGLEKFALAALHPNLKSFTLQSTTYPNTVFRGDLPTRDFLKRHRQIEYLNLVYLPDEDGRVEKLEIGNEDLPNLRAVSILGEDFGFPLPNRPIEAMDIGTFPTLDQLPKLPRSTLKFMSVRRSHIRDENPQVAEILSEFPTLAELTLHCGDVYTKGGILTLEEEHLIQFFQTLAATPNCANSLTALTFSALWGEKKKELSPELLADIPCPPPNLKYLRWGVNEKMRLYELKRSDGKTTATEIEPLRAPTARTLFVDNSIIDHFGERARDW